MRPSLDPSATRSTGSARLRDLHHQQWMRCRIRTKGFRVTQNGAIFGFEKVGADIIERIFEIGGIVDALEAFENRRAAA